MAAPMATHVRIKVYFENNEFDASWLLIDTNDLRTMKDVQRYISLKFLGKTVPLYLTLQGCYLPDWEKSVVLRDNDCVNAKCVHQDGFDNQTILVTNTLDEAETHSKLPKKKKKKDRVENDTKLIAINSLDVENFKEKRKEINHENNDSAFREVCSENDLVTMETSEQKQKKKKHKHDCDEETDNYKEKKRKRKLDGKEKDEHTEDHNSFIEPLSKRVVVAECETNKSELQPNVLDSSTLEHKDRQPDLAAEEKGQNISDQDKITDNAKDGLKKNRKRKRVRKRKRENGSTVQKSLSETPKFSNSVNESWNWSNGKTLENTCRPEYGSKSNSKHKVFQSDSNDSDDNRETDNAQNSDAACNFDKRESNGTETCPDKNYDMYDRSYTKQSFSSSVYNGGTAPGGSKTVSVTPSGREIRSKQVLEVVDQPSILSTSYLANGVAVYSRSRGKQQQNLKQYAELSKEEQLNTRLTNVSVVLQNTVNKDPKNQSENMEEKTAIYEAVPLDKNYSRFPALVGPPRVGDRLAYKVIELSETYTPEVSDYKEAIVRDYNIITKTVELENLQENSTLKRRPEGKFEVDLEDDEDICCMEDVMVCIHIDSLIEPKLLS